MDCGDHEGGYELRAWRSDRSQTQRNQHIGCPKFKELCENEPLFTFRQIKKLSRIFGEV
jgi:hypothetical protein